MVRKEKRDEQAQIASQVDTHAVKTGRDFVGLPPPRIIAHHSPGSRSNYSSASSPHSSGLGSQGSPPAFTQRYKYMSKSVERPYWADVLVRCANFLTISLWLFHAVSLTLSAMSAVKTYRICLKSLCIIFKKEIDSKHRTEMCT